MAAAKPLVVVIIAFLLVAAAAIPLPGGGGELPHTFPPAEAPSVSLPGSGAELPYTLAPAEPPSVPFPDSGGHLPFTVLSADPAAAGCRGSVGMCPERKEVAPGLGAAGGASTMSADAEQVRRRVHHQQRDSVPCSRRGASYYNCRAQDSPYRRACSRIKHCHG